MLTTLAQVGTRNLPSPAGANGAFHPRTQQEAILLALGGLVLLIIIVAIVIKMRRDD